MGGVNPQPDRCRQIRKLFCPGDGESAIGQPGHGADRFVMSRFRDDDEFIAELVAG